MPWEIFFGHDIPNHVFCLLMDEKRGSIINEFAAKNSSLASYPKFCPARDVFNKTGFSGAAGSMIKLSINNY